MKCAVMLTPRTSISSIIARENLAQGEKVFELMPKRMGKVLRVLAKLKEAAEKAQAAVSEYENIRR